MNYTSTIADKDIIGGLHCARSWYAVTRPRCTEAVIYPRRDHAEAVAAAKRFDFPSIGPWTVVELREVV